MHGGVTGKAREGFPMSIRTGLFLERSALQKFSVFQ
jgi:hypothetical protein